MNYSLKILNHLFQFNDDGSFHEVESVVQELRRDQVLDILRDLRREEYVRFTDPYKVGVRLVSKPRPRPNFQPIQAKITLKGRKFLENQKKDTHSMSINTGQGSINNLILNPPGAKISYKSQAMAQSKIQEIIETLRLDSGLSDTQKAEAISLFEQANVEIDENQQLQPNTFERIVALGSDISSIGALILTLLTLLKLLPGGAG